MGWQAFRIHTTLHENLSVHSIRTHAKDLNPLVGWAVPQEPANALVVAPFAVVWVQPPCLPLKAQVIRSVVANSKLYIAR